MISRIRTPFYILLILCVYVAARSLPSLRSNKVDMTTLNTITFLLLFSKKMAASFSEISGEEIQKLEEKTVNKNTVKTAKLWMNVLKS